MQDLNSPVFGVAGSDSEVSDKILSIADNKAKKGNKKSKILVSILSVLILAGGVVAGIFLIQRSQELREKAANVGGSDCGQSLDCYKIDLGQNSGTYTSERTIDHFIIKARTEAYSFPGVSSNCYSVNINQKTVTWQKVGSASDCHDISHVEVWFVATELPTTPPNPTATSTPVPTATTAPGQPTVAPTIVPTVTLIPNPTLTPTPTAVLQFIASCNGLFTYDTNWNLLTSEDLSEHIVGDIIRFATSATVNQGYVTKAKFVINNTQEYETTLKKPGTDLFYYDYTIPEGVTDFSVKAFLYHSTQGWF